MVAARLSLYDFRLYIFLYKPLILHIASCRPVLLSMFAEDAVAAELLNCETNSGLMLIVIGNFGNMVQN